MLFSSVSYDPETIIFLDECLDAACAVALLVPGAQATPQGIDLRRKLALALMEGFGNGLRHRTELIEFTLRALPAFRAAAATG